MKASLRITRVLLADIRRDLERPHEFASERVGFVFCRFGLTKTTGLVVLAHEYMSVADDDYIDDGRFGALIGAGAFRRALERSLGAALGIFHIHMHAHAGLPSPSGIDLIESRKFVPDFFHVHNTLPHGTLIVSRNAISGRVWRTETSRPVPFSATTVVGAPMAFWRKSA